MNGIKNLPTLYWKCDISVSEVSPLSIQTPLHKALLKWTKMNQLDWNGQNRSVWNKWTEMDWVDWCRPKWTKINQLDRIDQSGQKIYLNTLPCYIWLQIVQMSKGIFLVRLSGYDQAKCTIFIFFNMCIYIYIYVYIFVLRSKCRANIT